MSENRRKITIYDVAHEADVTIATVSRVINGKDNVADATRAKVVKAIEKLNYYPSPIASGLSRNKSQEIGVLVPFFFGEFFLNLLEGITREMSEYDIILYNAKTPEEKKRLLAKVAGENKLDGLFIVSLPITLEDELLIKNAKFPVILLDNKHKKYSSVSFDNVFGAFTAVEFLIEQGHQRIGLITGAAEDPFHLTIAKDRFKGYKMALSMAEIPLDDTLIHINDWSRNGANAIAKKMLAMDNPPTAIFTISDLQAVGVIDAVKELGLKIPDDVSVIGYDNLAFSDYMNITTISQPLNICAQVGSGIMLKEIENNSHNTETIILQPALVERTTVMELTNSLIETQ